LTKPYIRRADLIPSSRAKIVPPFALDEALTLYCPQENVDSLDHPDVRAFQKYVSVRYIPPALPGRAVLLILPCSKTKPYPLSPEHLAINGRLIEAGFAPAGTTPPPRGLESALPPGTGSALLDLSPLRRDGITVHRAVVSEPLGLVPYDLIYAFRGRRSPATCYDDPGLFEHRGTAVCPWRKDSTAVRRSDGTWAWGPNEKHAYVEMHNRLSEIMARTLERLQPRYERIIAYVGPRMTHRSFFAAKHERSASGLATARRTAAGLENLVGVNDRVPGLVQILPTASDFRRLRAGGGRAGASPLAHPAMLGLLLRALRG
jgi:hypothetical protein